MTKKIAITGGIGSGKTFVCQIFKSLGVPIYYADERAKYLMDNNYTVINQIKMLFGFDIYSPKLDRKRMAEIVFKNKAALEALNSIVHPAVRDDFQEWTKVQNTPYVIEEAAILFEVKQEKYFDKIITVTADEEVRIGRAIKRDNTTREAVLARISNQIDNEYKVKNSDYVIYNNENDIETSFLNLIPQIFKIHNELITNSPDIYKHENDVKRTNRKNKRSCWQIIARIPRR